jgi:hypothetical protein
VINHPEETKMNFRTAALLASAVLWAAPAWSATIHGGFEDTVAGDYDYNDLVYSLSGSGLSVNPDGASLFTQPLLNGSAGTNGLNDGLFWNNDSSDGANYGVGFCIYGGGACNGGVGLDPSADYIAASNNNTTGSANHITFADNGTVDINIAMSISADADTLGWYSTANPSVIHMLGGIGAYSFNPGGTFGLVGSNATETFYSDTEAGGVQDAVSHFAFFTDPTPEPATFLMLGVGGVVLGGLRRAGFPGK